ncbi:hypothetical protein SAMN06297280_1557 [Arsukibacterium tuosuense]|uniref:Uncharacterized protein n=1 Tax=Arsukibacterium tuosuense TaxID=1323745 RepID=A0A285IP99_9GAMM|nr:hypothetical protein [Arsukibacterium tuosuense]SNY49835.1 hypothetical protein SAMN06297280_1557 [Arsukibacterium tuosuense]
MRIMLILLLASLSGCQLLNQQRPVPEPAAEPELTEQQNLPQDSAPGIEVALSLSDDPATLRAWVNYRASLLNNRALWRESLSDLSDPDPVQMLQRIILQLHPDTPYLTRLRVQMQLAEQIAALPPGLAALISWDLTFNQKLLETESAVSALTRLNAQQHDNIERLQKKNKDLQKKIDALTQIEAQLNESINEGNNGRP